MKPDVIVSWPRHTDYPLWRQFIEDERARFNRVLVVFTEHAGHDYSGWITATMGPDVECFWSPPRGDRDWRDVAVNAALNRSDADWVWFTEQDFFITDPAAFWSAMGYLAGTAEAVGWRDEFRWHPASLLVRRDAVERTDRYFGPEPMDHFVAFGRQLTVAPLPAGCYEHLQGISQNHWLLDETGSLETPGIFARDRFIRYLADSLAVAVPLHPTWQRTAEAAIQPYAGRP